jgi:hypothetical protein
MSGRRAIVGLCMLCALIFSAVAAQGAAAAGTTGFTCAATEGGVGFSDAHCLTAVGSAAKFKHVEIAAGTVTNATITNEKTAAATSASTPAKLVTKKSGVTVEIECTVVTGAGTGQNVAGPPMKVEGTLTTEYKTCKVLKPANCTVTEPIVVANAKAATFHTGAGATEKGVKFSPAAAIFTEIKLAGATCPLVGTFPVEGSAIGRPNGATTVFNVGEDELTFAKEPADLQGAATISTRAGAAGAFTPLTVTTTAS